MHDLGFVLEETQSTPESFGSWFIRATAKGKTIRVVWDGRDRTLILQELASAPAGNWVDRWVARPDYKHRPSELREGLISVLGG